MLLGEAVDRRDRFLADRGVVKGQVALDDAGDQPGLARRKALLADFGGARHICLQGVLRRNERAHRARGDFGRALDQMVGRRQNRHRVVESSRAARWGAAPHIEHDAADARCHRQLGGHAVGPEPVDRALFERLGRGQAEIDARSRCARHRADADVVALRIEAGGGEQPAQPHLDPGRGPDAAPSKRGEVAARDAEIAAHHQKPVHALRQGAQAA